MSDFGDFFATPAGVVRAILPFLPRVSTLDPCCGDGAILRVLAAEPIWRKRSHRGFEINTARAHSARRIATSPDRVVERDGLAAMSWSGPLLVLTNPPYSGAIDFAERAIVETAPVNGTVALLLRLGFLASAARGNFHRQHPSDIYVLEGRPSFCMSVRCKGDPGCSWGVQLPLDAARPKRCPECDGDVGISTTDASEYAWFVWGPGRGGRWQTLPWDKPSARKPAEAA